MLRKGVNIVSVDLLTKDERTAPAPFAQRTAADDELRATVRKHLERVRRLKLHVAAYLVGMLVLTPVWALTQWETSGGFQRWSTDHSRPGDWEPWIAYVALGWGLIVAINALKVHFDRPTSEDEIAREIGRLESRR